MCLNYIHYLVRSTRLIFAFSLLTAISGSAEVPGILTYQGSLSINGAPYTGTAYLKFAITDVTGTTNIWIHDNISPEQPGNSITTSVNSGLFTVNLGDTSVPNMAAPIPPLAFVNIPPYLKIWVSTNNTNFQLLTPFTRLTAAPFALDAQTAQTVPNGSITATKLAPGAITGTASLSLTGSTLQLNDAGGSTSVNLASITSTNSWKLRGNNITAGDFIGGTNNQALEFRVNNQTALRLDPNTNGYLNFISGPTHTVSPGIFGSVMIGGGSNTMATSFGLMVGGFGNKIETNSFTTAIIGAQESVIESNNLFSTIVGGYNNRITAGAYYGTIVGGSDNIATDRSFAAGFLAHATNSGSFVWADGLGQPVGSFADNSVTMRATGGYRLYAGANGVSLASNSGSWTSLSDRNAKKNFESVDSTRILEKVVAMPLTTWTYKGQDENIRHLGPMAQDFKEAFGLGETDTGISNVDADGVALAAIQGLNQKLEQESKEKCAEIELLKNENASLQQRLSQLEQFVKQLTK